MRRPAQWLLKGMALWLPFFFSVSCTREPRDEDAAALTAIQVDGTAITLDEGATAVLLFRVTDSGYSFVSDVAASDCAVSLVTADNHAPVHVRLAKVARQAGAGEYSATLQDAGTGAEYREDMHLRIVRKDGTAVLSGKFTVSSAEKLPVPDTGLPILWLSTSQAVTSKDTYVSGSVRIDGRGVAEGLDAVTCQVRGRGNTTWTWPKKPYLIKFDQRQSLFGFPAHKRWVLLANFLDRTMMRNLVAMKVSSMTGLDWTPRCRSVELMLNGRHMGNYLLIEQVRVDENRVPITEMAPEDGEGDALSGGYLLESDFHYDNKIQWLSPYGRSNQWIQGRNDVVPFGIKYPDEDVITAAQTTYIRNYVNQAAAALYGPEFKDPDKGYAAWLDVDSYIDYWIVFEVMGNHELGNPGSVFMHKDRGGRLTAGPCWDFDWGVLSYNTSPQARYGLLNDQAIWYARLFQDPAFKAKVKARFEQLLPQLQTILAYIDQLEGELTASAALNFAMWNPAQDASQNGGRIINGDENMTFHEAVRRLRSIYEERLTVIREHL